MGILGSWVLGSGFEAHGFFDFRLWDEISRYYYYYYYYYLILLLKSLLLLLYKLLAQLYRKLSTGEWKGGLAALWPYGLGPGHTVCVRRFRVEA